MCAGGFPGRVVEFGGSVLFGFLPYELGDVELEFHGYTKKYGFTSKLS